MDAPEMTTQVGAVPATHRDPLQPNTTGLQLLEPGTKGIQPTGTGVNLNRIGTHLLQQPLECCAIQHMAVFLNQPQGAGHQATPTSIAALFDDTTARCINGPGRTNPGAGTGTISRAALRVKAGLAKVRITAVAQAEHQPRSTRQALLASPGHATPNCSSNSGISGNIKAVGTSQRSDGREIFQGCKVVIARPTNPFDPTPLLQGLAGAEIQLSW